MSQRLRALSGFSVVALILLLCELARAGEVAPLGFPSGPLSMADAVNIALTQNPRVRQAQKKLEAAQGVVVQTRAVAIPKLLVSGNYTAVQPAAVDQPEFPPGVPGFTFGTDQSWRTQIRLVQSIYQGGRVLSSLRSAKLIRDQSLLAYEVAVSDAVLEVQVAYFAVLLSAEQITVQEASVELLTRELTDTTRRFEAGTVPRFNVLRAEVELANARPKLSRARNHFRISKNLLANSLGLTIPRETLEDIPLKLSDAMEAVPWDIQLPLAVAMAMENRKELAVLLKNKDLRKEELTSAKAGYLPNLEAFGGYDFYNSMFSTDLTDELHGWTAGVQLRWELFDGMRTSGKVREAKAQYELAGVELEDEGRRIELEVRTSYSTFIEAGEVLKSQEKVLEQAEEALRLARARSEAGTGTQLDVLSAQTALTDARTFHAQALHDYCVARVRLERAIGANRPMPATR